MRKVPKAKTGTQAEYHRPVRGSIRRETIPTKMCLLCPLQNFVVGIQRSPDAVAQVGEENMNSIIW
jgi:hypothetical protein